MIHRFVFASPKPGMTEESFHSHWRESYTHHYAGNISELRSLALHRRVSIDALSKSTPWHGFAELTFASECDLVQSLQSDTYLQHVRLDEPEWAAIWNTFVMDANLATDQGENDPGERSVKLALLLKRKSGLSVADFRDKADRMIEPMLRDIDGLVRYQQFATLDSEYFVGEPRFDGLHICWFASRTALDRAIGSSCSPVSLVHATGLCDPRGLGCLAVEANSETKFSVNDAICGHTSTIDEPIDEAPMTAESGLMHWSQRSRSGARAIAEQLREAGLVGQPDSLLIGNPGSGEEWLYLELTEEVHLGLAEAAVGNIADGAGRIRSKPAIVVAHGFVGFSGLQGAVFNAAQRQSPMLVIVGTADSNSHTGESHMYADVQDAAKSTGAKYVKNASDPRTLLRDLRDAIVESMIPPFGPVVFIVGSNVASAPNSEPVVKPAIPNTRLAPPASVIEELAVELLNAEKPAILIGDGIARSQATPELQAVVELIGAEVWASMESEVNLPRNHPSFQGNLGHMTDERGRDLLKGVDFALAVGTPIYQTVFNSTRPLFDPETRVATVNHDPESSLRGHNDVDFPIQGDPQRILSMLARAIEHVRTSTQANVAAERLTLMGQRKDRSLQERRVKQLQSPGVTIAKFGRALECRMSRMSDRPTIFNEALLGAAGLTDHIENANYIGKYFDTSGGSLGEWAGAVGAALVGVRTITIIGDGGFHYAPQTLWNAAQMRLPLGLVVANNSTYGLLHANMDAALTEHGIDPTSVPRRHYYELSNIDYVAIAKGYGVPGTTVTNDEQIEEAVDRMLAAKGPFLIDLVLNKTI